jgi:hypothetical protein
MRGRISCSKVKLRAPLEGKSYGAGSGANSCPAGEGIGKTEQLEKKVGKRREIIPQRLKRESFCRFRA